MRCLYEVLELELDADDATIKKQYRKLALKWHPDKNAHQAELAHEHFQEVQNAWEVLSDPQERAWYDSHRAQILRSQSRHQAGTSGDDVAGGGENPFGDIDIAGFQTKAAFAGYDDGPRSFYSVYDDLFKQVRDQECAAQRRQKASSGRRDQQDPVGAPCFGAADASEEQVRSFYMHWCNFQTCQDFSWLDEYNAASAPGRRVRRLMEAENEKKRKAGKMAWVTSVRSLTEWLRGLDKRVQQFNAEAADRKKERQEAEARRREEQKAAKRQAAAAYQDADWIRAAEEEQLAAMDEQAQEEEDAEVFECVVCDKIYKTEKALRNHENSKKHKEQLKRFKAMMLEEDNLDMGDLHL